MKPHWSGAASARAVVSWTSESKAGMDVIARVPRSWIACSQVTCERVDVLVFPDDSLVDGTAEPAAEVEAQARQHQRIEAETGEFRLRVDLPPRQVRQFGDPLDEPVPDCLFRTRHV